VRIGSSRREENSGDPEITHIVGGTRSTARCHRRDIHLCVAVGILMVRDFRKFRFLLNAGLEIVFGCKPR